MLTLKLCTDAIAMYDNSNTKIDINKKLISDFPLRKNLYYDVQTKQTIIDYLSKNHFNDITGLSQLTLEYLDICNVFSLNQTSAEFTLKVYYGDLRWCHLFEITASPYKSKNIDTYTSNGVGWDKKQQDQNQDEPLAAVDYNKDIVMNNGNKNNLKNNHNASQLQLQILPKQKTANNNININYNYDQNNNTNKCKEIGRNTKIIKCGTTYFGSVKFDQGSGWPGEWTSNHFTFIDSCQFKIYKDNNCEIFRIDGYLESKMRCTKSYYNENKDGLEKSIKKVQYCLKNKMFYIPFKQIENFWMLDDDVDMNTDTDHDMNKRAQAIANQRYLVYRNKYHGPWCHWFGNDLDYLAEGKVNINLVTKNDKLRDANFQWKKEKKVEHYELCSLD